jgi:WD40 repeat protein
MLATGGGADDKIIRLWDLKRSKDVQHSIRCNSQITSLQWRKAKLKVRKETLIEDISQVFCEELVSCHGTPDNEIKLW